MLMMHGKETLGKKDGSADDRSQNWAWSNGSLSKWSWVIRDKVLACWEGSVGWLGEKRDPIIIITVFRGKPKDTSTSGPYVLRSKLVQRGICDWNVISCN